MIRCAIVDDEPHARQLLRNFLSEHEDIDIVAEYGDGITAVDGLRATRPDVAFIDIQMPELDGFGVAETIGLNMLPMIVFVTAYDQHALRAFDVNAVDYVLKPLDRERLNLTVTRLRTRLAQGDHSGQGARLASALDQLRQQTLRYDRLVITVGDRTFLQRVEEIDWVEADGKFVRINVGNRNHVMRESLSRVEARLDPARFIRVSRSAIVNIDRISEIRPWFKGEYILLMQNGAKITTTRSYRSALTTLLEGDE